MTTTPPVNKVGNIDIPWSVVVQRADEDWARDKHRELQYDFPAPGRWFYADPYNTGAYRPSAFSGGFSGGFDSPYTPRP